MLVERGCRPDQSAVTVMAAESPHQFYNQLSPDAEGVLTTLADQMKHSGGAGRQPQYVVTLAGEHMRTIAASGWGKREVRQVLSENTQNTLAHLKRTHRTPGPI